MRKIFRHNESRCLDIKPKDGLDFGVSDRGGVRVISLRGKIDGKAYFTGSTPKG